MMNLSKPRTRQRLLLHKLRPLVKRIDNEQELSVILNKIPNYTMRVKVLQLIEPMLKFKLESGSESTGWKVMVN